MNNLNVELTPQALALVPAVAILIQVIKRMEIADKLKQWLPFVSIGLALGLAYLTGLENPILPSIIIGLTASGAYDLAQVKKELPAP